MTARRSIAGPGTLCLVVLLVVLLAVPSVSASAFRPPAPAVASDLTYASLGAAEVYAGSFATRAGYEGSYIPLISHPRPAVGPESVMVTFFPSTPAFFTPPPLGAAPLSVAEIANEYGLSPSAFAAAEQYFTSQGLTIVHASPDRLSLTLTGTASAIGDAFGTALEAGAYAGKPVTIPLTSPSLPAPLESEVSSVTGLSSGFDSFSLPPGLPSTPALTSASGPAGDPDLITPAIARQIYDLSALYNRSGSSQYSIGQGIVLLLWGDGYAPNDLNSFFANDYPGSFPLPNIVGYPVDGAPSPSANAVNDPSNAPRELTLDLEWSGSMAPGATLDAVYAPDGPAADNYSPSDTSMEDALNEAVTGISGVSAISMSFGTPENSSVPLQTAFTTDFATATHEGITILGATGDFGGDYAPNCQGGIAMDFPASSPDVIAVGGTDPVLSRNAIGQPTGLASESAWSGSAGGFSTVYKAPSWQEVGNAASVISANGYRATPDVAAAATYNYLYYDGTDAVAAGTSFSTPLWAGLVTEMDATFGAKLGFVTPRLYDVGANQEAGKGIIGLGNVTGGTTCIGTAGPGWNTETGWGSPRALNLYEDLTATFVNLTVSATPSPVAPGGTVTLLAELSNRTSGAPIPGVPVQVSLQASDPNGPCAGVWGSGNISSNATGFVSLSVAVPACYFGSHGTATVTVIADGLYGTNSTTFEINLLGFVPALAGIENYPLNVVAFGAIMAVVIAIGYVLGRPPRRTRYAPPASTGPPPGAQEGAPPARSSASLPPPSTPSPSPPPPPRNGPPGA